MLRTARRGLALVLGGLAIQMAALLFWSPGTFIVSATVGFPLVILGAGSFALAWWRAPRTAVGQPE